MDLSFTPEDTAFQQEVRSWIAGAYTPDLRAKMAMSKNGYLDKEGQVAWQRKLNERGWVAPNWPEEHGGPGLSPSQRYILNMDCRLPARRRSAPWGFPWLHPLSWHSAQKSRRNATCRPFSLRKSGGVRGIPSQVPALISHRYK